MISSGSMFVFYEGKSWRPKIANMFAVTILGNFGKGWPGQFTDDWEVPFWCLVKYLSRLICQLETKEEKRMGVEEEKKRRRKARQRKAILSKIGGQFQINF